MKLILLIWFSFYQNEINQYSDLRVELGIQHSHHNSFNIDAFKAVRSTEQKLPGLRSDLIQQKDDMTEVLLVDGINVPEKSLEKRLWYYPTGFT